MGRNLKRVILPKHVENDVEQREHVERHYQIELVQREERRCAELNDECRNNKRCNDDQTQEYEPEDVFFFCAHPNCAIRLKTGRYMDMTMVPIKLPTKMRRIGSNIERRPPTVASTSSS